MNITKIETSEGVLSNTIVESNLVETEGRIEELLAEITIETGMKTGIGIG
jgi:hypothetical protein